MCLVSQFQGDFQHFCQFIFIVRKLKEFACRPPSRKYISTQDETSRDFVKNCVFELREIFHEKIFKGSSFYNITYLDICSPLWIENVELLQTIEHIHNIHNIRDIHKSNERGKYIQSERSNYGINSSPASWE